MRKLKSFTSIWSIEKVIYAINDFNLPFPVTITQIGWFVGTFFLIIVFDNIPPLSLIDNMLVKYFAIPFGVAFIMNRKSFDGKKPVGFIKSVVGYFSRPKLTYGHKIVDFSKERIDENITIVRSGLVNDEVSDQVPD